MDSKLEAGIKSNVHFKSKLVWVNFPRPKIDLVNKKGLIFEVPITHQNFEDVVRVETYCHMF